MSKVLKFDPLTLLTIVVIVGVVVTMQLHNSQAGGEPTKKAEQLKVTTYANSQVAKTEPKPLTLDESVVAQLP